MIISGITKRLEIIKKNRLERRARLESQGLFSFITDSSGYVLIMVLLMTGLLVSVSGDFIVTTQTDIRYMRKFDHRLKAGTLARSGVELATYILEADKQGLAGMVLPGRNTDKAIDTWQDVWAIDFPSMPFEDGILDLRIDDENSKINLSVLANEVVDKTPYYAITQRFFLNMGLSMDFADIIMDWVDIDDSRFPYGAESGDYYNTLTPSYSAKNSAMDSINDLLFMKDMTPEIFYGLGGTGSVIETNLVDDNHGDTSLSMDLVEDMISHGSEAARMEVDQKKEKEKEEADIPIGKEKSRRLSDYLRVYGNRQDYLNTLNKININTASFRVISALTDKMSDDIVSEVIRRRNVTPFKSVDELKDLITEDTVRNNILTVSSSIFRIRSTVQYQETTVRVLAIYNRDAKKFHYWCQY